MLCARFGQIQLLSAGDFLSDEKLQLDRVDSVSVHRSCADLLHRVRCALGVAAAVENEMNRFLLALIILILMVSGAMCWAVEAIIGVGVL